MHQDFMRGRAGPLGGSAVWATSRRTAFRPLAMAVAMFAGLMATAATGTAQDQQPANGTLALLAPPDLSSPRATLSALRQSVDSAYALLIEAYDEHRTDPGFGVSPEVAEKVSEARLLLRRAIATLDLSQVSVNRQKTGLETVLLLKEVLDRLPAIPPDAVPGADEVAAAEAAKAPIVDWLIPYSDLHIVRAGEGSKAGQYVFSANTVARAPEFYDSIKSLPQRPGSAEDFFEFYSLTPGELLPPKWYLWIEELPAWTRMSIGGQAVWQWAGMLIALVVLFGGYWVIWRGRRRRVLTLTAPRRFLVRMAAPVFLIFVCIVALAVVDELNITGIPYKVVDAALYAAAYLAGASLAYLLCAGAAEWIISSPRINPASLDASLIRLVARTIGIAAVIVIVFLGATDVGLPVYGVIAGLGVGGLALGLAARPTLENLIGGLILYADRPVRVGDFCQFGDKRGTVEEIGLRSTRIRALDRTVITVPNAEFSNMELINYTRRDRTHLRTTISLRYETTREQMRQVLDRIRTLLGENPDVIKETVRVRFVELGTYALGVEVYAYIDRPTNSGFLEVQEAILLAIMQVVEDCGTAIAFPSQTLYLHRNVEQSLAGHPG